MWSSIFIDMKDNAAGEDGVHHTGQTVARE